MLSSSSMARLSHGLLGALNLVTLLLSLPVLCAGVYFLTRATTECERALQIPVIAFGAALLLFSLIGFAGACGHRGAATPFLWVYVVFMFLLVVAVFAFTVFTFMVTNRGAGSAVSGREYKEYRLGDYDSWLQARIAEPETWRRVESCLSEARVCGGRLRAVGKDAMEFYKQHLSPIQSGCCKPPTWCRFRYVNATFWEAPSPRSGSSPAAASDDGDCRAWSNDPQVLCFECDTCKGGVLETAKTKWKTVAIVNVSLLAFLIVVYTIGCCALRTKGGSRHSNGVGP